MDHSHRWPEPRFQGFNAEREGRTAGWVRATARSVMVGQYAPFAVRTTLLNVPLLQAHGVLEGILQPEILRHARPPAATGWVLHYNVAVLAPTVCRSSCSGERCERHTSAEHTGSAVLGAGRTPSRTNGAALSHIPSLPALPLRMPMRRLALLCWLVAQCTAQPDVVEPVQRATTQGHAAAFGGEQRYSPEALGKLDGTERAASLQLDQALLRADADGLLASVEENGTVPHPPERRKP